MEVTGENNNSALVLNYSQTTAAAVGIGNDSGETDIQLELSSAVWVLNPSSEGNGSDDGISMDIFDYPGVTETFIVIYSVLWLFCVVGNCLVLTVMTRSPALRSRTNLYLCHLSVADLSVGLVCIIPNLVVARVLVWIPGPAGTVLCKFYNFFEEFSMTVSVLLLVLIAAERYVAIIHPLKARRLFTRCRMYTALAGVWLAACLYNVPLLFVYVTFDIGSQTYCFRQDGEDQVIDMALYVLLSFLLTYLLPLLLMATMYLKISFTLWRSSPANVLQREQAGSKRSKVAAEEAGRTVAAKEDTGKSAEQKTSRQDRHGPTKTPSATDSSLSEGSNPYQPTQPLPADSAKGHGGRGKETGDSHSSSSTSLTSCSSASVSTANSTGTEGPTAHRHDKTLTRPLLRAFRSDASTVRGDANTVANCQRCRGTPRHLSHPIPVRRHRDHANGHSGETAGDYRQRFSTDLTSSESTTPLLPQQTAGGGGGVQCATSPAAAPPPIATSMLTTSGSRDGVYVLRSGQTRNVSCRYRVTSHHVLVTRRKVVRLLIAVLSTFALCVLPFHIRVLLRYWMPESTLFTTGLPKYISQILFFLNSALNPVLYSLMSDSFRRCARQVLCCSYRFQRRDANMAALRARDVRQNVADRQRGAVSRAALVRS